MGEKRLNIEVVYATPDRQWLVALDMPGSATVDDAVNAALSAELPSSELRQMPVGIWGRLVDRSRRLKEGDRVELYRPLMRDPRDARRDLAAEGKSMSAATREDSD